MSELCHHFWEEVLVRDVQSGGSHFTDQTEFSFPSPQIIKL